MRAETMRALALGLFLAASSVACAENAPEPNVGPEERPEPTAANPTATEPAGDSDEADAAGVRIADIVADPTRFAGKTVRVESDVEEVYGNNAFKLDEEALAQGGIDNDILVLVPKGVSPSVGAIDDQILNDSVDVVGTVRPFVVAEIERELGIDLTPQIEAEFKNKAVIIAKQVSRAEES